VIIWSEGEQLVLISFEALKILCYSSLISEVEYEDKDHQEEDQPLVCELCGDNLNGIKGSDTHSRSNNCLFVDFIVVVISMNLIISYK
jgi:hypothetical protein